MANEILSQIKLDLDALRADLKDSVTASKKAGEDGGKGLGEGIEAGVKNVGGTLKAIALAVGAAFGAAFTVKEAVAAASEQEDAIQGLNLALANSGKFSDEASKHFQDFASNLQRTTGVADEVIAKGGALIESLGNLSGEGLERATKSALDLSAALHIDVNSAFSLIAKASTGNVSALARYGIEAKKTGDEARDFANALDAIDKKFKGLAETSSNTFAGALSKTKGQFGEVLESIGNIIIQSPTLVRVLDLAAKFFASLADQITKFAGSRDLIGDLAKKVVEIGQAIAGYVLPPLELFYNAAKLTVLTLAEGFTGLIAIFGFVGQAITEAVIKPVVDFLAGGLAQLVSFIDEDAAKSLENFVTSTTQGVSDGFAVIADKAGAATLAINDQTQKAAADLFTFDATQASENFLANAKTFLDSVQPQLKTDFKALSDAVNANRVEPTFFTAFAEGFISANKSMINSAKELGAQINATIKVGVTNSFAAMGAALANGKNGFEAFGKAMIGVLGDIAIQAGATFIGLGIAKTIAFDPTGPLLIGAGAALAVLGGALKAFGGRGGASGPGAWAGAAASGGGVAGDSSGFAPTQNKATDFQDTQRAEVGTAVSVIVQGNILDRRETGLALADVINETFGSNGITFAQAAV